MEETLRDVGPGEVVASDLWERFRIYHTRPRGLKGRLFRFERAVFEEFWALKGISFDLAPGESLALIGANGSGKTTLLKCLAGILSPDRGHVDVGGKVASLLELGAGFHGDLTGRENIFLNSSILGLTRRETERAYEDIVRFAGIEDFIDSPVRNYSSGMYVRLGFSVAIHVDPDVLLIDEILAVGDAEFQTKCFERMHNFRRRGKTIVLVTHDLDSAVRVCDRGILLEHGEAIFEGPTREVVDVYRQRLQMKEDEKSAAVVNEPRNRWGTGGAEITGVELLNADGDASEAVAMDGLCTFRFMVRFTQEVEEPIFGYILRAADGTEVFNGNTMWRGTSTGTYRPTDVVEVRFRQRMRLLPGRYSFTTAVAHRDGTQWYDWWSDCLFFHVRGQSLDRGYVNIQAEFEFGIVSPEGKVLWSS